MKLKLRLKKPADKTAKPPETDVPLEEALSLSEIIGPESKEGTKPQKTTKIEKVHLSRFDQDAPLKTLLRKDGVPREYHTRHMQWMEVLSSSHSEKIEAAKKLLLKNVMSNFVVLDPKTGELLLMTSGTFWRDAHDLLEKEGFEVIDMEEMS